MEKLQYITILRALAILSVLIVHVGLFSTGLGQLHHYFLSIINNGSRGVQLFYILSAFTLFHSFYCRRYLNETKPVVKYFIRRFFRIAPLYYLAIIYYLWEDGLGARYWLGNAKNITSGNIISNFLFVNGFNPYWINSIVPGGWSVAIEVTFYCFLPFLFYRIRNLQKASYFVIITLFIRLVFNFFLTRHILISDSRLWTDYLYLYLPNQLPVFAMGILLYFYIYGDKDFRFSSKALFIYSAIILLVLAVGSEFLITEIEYWSLAFLLLIYAIYRYQPKMLFNPVFNYIGNISYTLYLTHFAGLYILNKFKFLNLIETINTPLCLLNFIMNYFMVLMVSVLISTILYYTVENPMQKVGKTVVKLV